MAQGISVTASVTTHTRGWRQLAVARMLNHLMNKKLRKALWMAPGVLSEKPAALGNNLPWQDARQLLQAAIRGMVASLDPYLRLR